MLSPTSDHPPSASSILTVVGRLMAGVVLLGLAGALTSIVIGQTNQGMATAVNQSGTLRMQSYRIALALTDTRHRPPQRHGLVSRLALEYEQRLISPRLTEALPASANDPVRLAYERIRWRWAHEMQHAVRRFAEAPADRGEAAANRDLYLAQVDGFVADVDTLVRLLEDRSERRIRILRWIQFCVLAATVALVLIALIVIRRRVVRPLGDLLDCADRARRGDFSARVRDAGADEIGRVGAALNLMTQGLSTLYAELEQRVADKTRDLAQSNRSLALLYRISRALETPQLDMEVLRDVIEETRTQLDLAGIALCLRDGCLIGGSGCITIGQAGLLPEGGPPWDCRLCDCAAIVPLGHAGDGMARPLTAPIDGFPVGDQERRLGVLCAVPHPGRTLEPWQRPLLKALAGHLATALNLMGSMREGRRLALHEERSILARELHDSLAQSLSYLKIQAARLDSSLRASDGSTRGTLPPPEAILSEIREGISSAYRQLRELLTTFRLRIDGRGLTAALAETLQEFSARSDLDIRLDDRMPPGLLSPNEEVHVMQIIRESISNVVHHAEAGRCAITLEILEDAAVVRIEDDGLGIGPMPTDRMHYGMAIMRERAMTLGGSLRIEGRDGGGTRVTLTFPPRGPGSPTGTDAGDAIRETAAGGFKP